tara:strand:+ start:50 stop:214 length:165 start_codon:yes stop_codon:yes gene_type:complete
MKNLLQENIVTTGNMGKKLTRTTPPKRGPNPQGLNIKNKKVKVVRLEKNNGRRR